MRRIFTAIRNLFHRDHVDRDLEAEVRSYSDLLQEEKMSNGMNSTDAKRAARMSIGGPEQLKEEIRDARASAWLESLWQDLRFGFRTLRKKPAFTAIAILSLALGTGAATAIFTLVDKILLRPLPYQNASQLVWMNEETAANDSTGVSWLNFQDWKRMNRVFTGMAGYRDVRIPLSEDGFSGLVSCRYVTADYFELMSVRPFLGRAFQTGENTPGGPQFAILSYEYWRDRYGSSPQALGKVIRFDSRSFTVIGVMPEGFGAVTRTAMWLPFEQNVPKAYLAGRDFAWFLYIVGRRAQGISFQQAQSDMSRVGDILAKEYPKIDENSRPVVKDLDHYMVGDNRPVLILVALAVTLLLVITCANLANLLLVKTNARRRELSVRMALGAAKIRVARQILTEGFVLASAGSLFGFFTAWAGVRIAAQLLPRDLPLAGPLGVDLRALAFTLAVTVIISFAIGLAPARFAMRADPQTSLRTSSNQIRGGNKRIHSALIVCEVALAIAVLVGTGLLIRTMRSLFSTDVGFETERLVTATVSLRASAYPNNTKRTEFIQQGIDRIQTIPGVISAAAVFPVPFTPQINQERLAIEGKPPEPGIERTTYISTVTYGYLEMMKIPILQGRAFSPQDAQPNIHCAVIDRTLATLYFQGENPIGKSIKLATDDFSDPTKPSLTIVGVAGAIRASSLDEVVPPRVYVLGYGPTFVVRTSGAPTSVERAIQDVIHALDRGVAVYDVGVMTEAIRSSQAPRLQAMYLLVGFSCAALMLAALGLYGVMSYLVGQRTNEIGIRMALGARPRDVRRLIFGSAAAMVLSGTAVGISAALILGRFMRSLLYHVQPADGLTIATVIAIVAAVAWIACYIPARRAMKVDPMVALRYE